MDGNAEIQINPFTSVSLPVLAFRGSGTILEVLTDASQCPLQKLISPDQRITVRNGIGQQATEGGVKEIKRKKGGHQLLIRYSIE